VIGTASDLFAATGSPFLAATIDPMPSSELAGYLVVSGVLFALGLCGFLLRRNMIVMFLCTELMFQAAALAFIAFGRFHQDVSGQVFVIFILTIAAAEAALALGLVVLLYRWQDTLSAEAWTELHE